MSSGESNAPIVIEGILKGSAGGASRSSSGPDAWELVFQLMPWKSQGETGLPSAVLRVVFPVSKNQLRAEMAGLSDGSAVRFTATELNEPADREWWLASGMLPLERLQLDQLDAKLREARQKWDAAVVVEDEVLGTMALDRTLGWFQGQRSAAHGSYSLSVNQSHTMNDLQADTDDLRRARAVVERFESTLPTILQAVANELLGLYNDTWREDEAVLDAQGFISRLALESAVVDPTDGMTLYFDDGDLFWGHAIEVQLGADATVQAVTLAG